MTQEVVLGSPPVPEPYAEHLPAALAEVGVPAYVLDRDGTICWQNAAGRALVGDAVGHLFTDVVALDDHEARRLFEHNLGSPEAEDHLLTVRGPHEARSRVEVSSVRLGPEHSVVGLFVLAVPEDATGGVPRSASPLTRRQQEVLEQLAQGASTAAIAERLVVSPETVRNHVRQILRRLNANSRLAAVAAARRDGLI